MSSGPNVPMVNYEQASVRVPVFVGSRAWEWFDCGRQAIMACVGRKIMEKLADILIT